MRNIAAALLSAFARLVVDFIYSARVDLPRYFLEILAVSRFLDQLLISDRNDAHDVFARVVRHGHRQTYFGLSNHGTPNIHAQHVGQ